MSFGCAGKLLADVKNKFLEMTAVEDSTGFMKHWKVVVAGVALRENVDTWYAIAGEWRGILLLNCY